MCWMVSSGNGVVFNMFGLVGCRLCIIWYGMGLLIAGVAGEITRCFVQVACLVFRFSEIGVVVCVMHRNSE